MSTSKPVLSDVVGGVAVLTLHRPERRNAWTVSMQAEYFDALQQCADEPAVRVIVLTGAGGAFCPGADAAALTTYAETGRTNPLAATIEQPEWFPTTVPKPIVAAIEGPCAGVGLAQALMCDLRVAAPDARFSTAFSRRGLPAMHGAEWLLERAAGASVAHDLLLTARTFSGLEAAQYGVVNETHQNPLDRALEIARDMAENCSPTSMAQLKDRLWTSRDRTLSQAVCHADAVVEEFLASADFAEGISSFLQRRRPSFAGVSTSETLSERTS